MTELPIKVLLMQYPLLDVGRLIRVDNVDEYALNCILWDDEPVPYSEVDAVLNSRNIGALRTTAPFAFRIRILKGMVQAGKFNDFDNNGGVADPARTLARGAVAANPSVPFQRRLSPPLAAYGDMGGEVEDAAACRTAPSDIW